MFKETDSAYSFVNLIYKEGDNAEDCLHIDPITGIFYVL